jgi:ketosteroid isomerase-like protein
MSRKIEIIKEFVDLFRNGDRDTMRKSLADDLIWYANQPRNKHGRGGVMRGPDAFLDMAFSTHLHTDNVKSVTIRHDPYLTDGNVVMVRQIEDFVRNTGETVTYVFLLCFEFNDRDQIRRCWEVTNSDFTDFPFS